MKKLTLFFTFLVLTAITSIAIPQSKSDKLEELLSKYNEYDILNGVVLVAEKGEIILEKGYGYADFDSKTPVTPQHQFRIGSVTKQFVASVIMQLIAEGKMSLDDVITDHITEYRKDTGSRITIRQLLNHTAGIHSYTNIPGW